MYNFNQPIYQTNKENQSTHNYNAPIENISHEVIPEIKKTKQVVYKNLYQFKFQNPHTTIIPYVERRSKGKESMELTEPVNRDLCMRHAESGTTISQLRRGVESGFC